MPGSKVIIYWPAVFLLLLLLVVLLLFLFVLLLLVGLGSSLIESRNIWAGDIGAYSEGGSRLRYYGEGILCKLNASKTARSRTRQILRR